MRPILMVPAAVGLLLAAGCTAGAGSTSNTPQNGSVTRSSAAPSLPSGIVTSRDNYPAGTKTLSVFDITSGTLLGSATAPQDASVTRLDAFNATMSQLTYTSSDCALHVATLQADGAYTESGRWAPPQAYGNGKQCFRDAQFSGNGRVRVTLSPSADEPGTVLSVNPGVPGEAPKTEGAGNLYESKKYTLVGIPESTATIHQIGPVITGADITGPTPGGNVLNDFQYTCNTVISEDRLLCTADYNVSRQYFGSVALAAVDRTSGTVAMTKVAPASTTRTGLLSEQKAVLLGPDRNTIAIHDSTGWYTTSIDGGGTPTRQPLSEQSDLGDILFWH